LIKLNYNPPQTLQMARNLTDKEKSDIAELIKDGSTWQSIVKQFNCSTSTIYRIVKDNGIEFKKSREPYKARITSHVPLTHTRNGESFLMGAF